MKHLLEVLTLCFVLLLGVYLFQYPKSLTLVPASTTQENQLAILTGTVQDATSHHPLSGVKVEIGGHIASTNSDGMFTLPLSFSVHEVVISKDGYETVRVPVDLSSKEKVHLSLDLVQK